MILLFYVSFINNMHYNTFYEKDLIIMTYHKQGLYNDVIVTLTFHDHYKFNLNKMSNF